MPGGPRASGFRSEGPKTQTHEVKSKTGLLPDPTTMWVPWVLAFLLTSSANGGSSSDVGVRQTLQQFLGVPGRERNGTSNLLKLPSYMVELYERYRNGDLKGKRQGNTVRSIQTALKDPSDMLVFKLSGIHEDERVLRAELHLHKRNRKQTHQRIRFRNRHANANSTCCKLHPSFRVRLLNLLPGSSPPRPVAQGITIPNPNAANWLVFDVTDGVVSVLSSATEYPTMGVRFTKKLNGSVDGRKFRKISKKKFLRKASALPFLIVFSQDKNSLQKDSSALPVSQSFSDGSVEEAENLPKTAGTDNSHQRDMPGTKVSERISDIPSNLEVIHDRSNGKRILDDFGRLWAQEGLQNVKVTQSPQNDSDGTSESKESNASPESFSEYPGGARKRRAAKDSSNPRKPKNFDKTPRKQRLRDFGLSLRELADLPKNLGKSWNSHETFKRIHEYIPNTIPEKPEDYKSPTLPPFLVSTATSSTTRHLRSVVDNRVNEADFSVTVNEFPEGPADDTDVAFRASYSHKFPTSGSNPSSVLIARPQRQRPGQKRQPRPFGQSSKRTSSGFQNSDGGLVNVAGDDNERACQRHKLVVDFADIGWGKWIISPKAFEAHYCSGQCPFPLTKSVRPSNHATIQSLVYALNPKSSLVPPPCCVPDVMTSLTLLYFDPDGNVVLKNYPQMSVQSCACR